MRRFLAMLWPAVHPALALGVSLVAIAVLTAILAPLHGRLALLNVGMLYLILVVLLTVRFGLGAGILASVLVNLALNFFFVPPLHRLSVSESENLIALLVFLGVTALTSTLLARAERGETLAREREREAALMFDLSRGVITDPGSRTVLPILCGKVRHAFGAESAAIFRYANGRWTFTAADGLAVGTEIPGDERLMATRALESGEVVSLHGALRGGHAPARIVGRASIGTPVAMVPLSASGQQLGVLRLTGSLQTNPPGTDGGRLLAAFAHVAALAINHQRLLQELTASRALQEADVLKTALLSTVSHELRTPLASIKASVTSLLEATADWDERARQEFLTAIDEETDRLTALVSNLLDLSRLEGGALAMQRDWYDLCEFLETVGERMRSRSRQRPIVVDTSGADGDVFIDYVLAGQAIQNLLENADKFSPPGRPIHVSAQAVNGGLDVRVDDEGPGIPPDERAHVFDKFFRGRDARGQVPGTGLGLAIARGMAAAHGAAIRAEEAPAGGARLVVSLPPEAYRKRPAVVGKVAG